MVTKGIGPWQSALFVRYQRLSLKATIACFGGFHNLLFGERYNTKIFYFNELWDDKLSFRTYSSVYTP